MNLYIVFKWSEYLDSDNQTVRVDDFLGAFSDLEMARRLCVDIKHSYIIKTLLDKEFSGPMVDGISYEYPNVNKSLKDDEEYYKKVSRLVEENQDKIKNLE
jgi:hypothetical protein